MLTEQDYERSAPVFNIQPYSIHDGPGIRVTVFIKGCPLRCVWCANPESQIPDTQLMVYSSKCTNCGRCVPVCPVGAVSYSGAAGSAAVVTDRAACTACGACAGVCPNRARELSGSSMTVRQVLDRVEEDRLFLEESGGGLTISGGEPLFHYRFSGSLLKAARNEGFHTAVESCAYASEAAVDAVFSHADLALLDVKHMDSETHKQLTGVPNEQILSNIRHIRTDLRVPVVIRVPVIPGCNDSEKNLTDTADFARSLGGSEVDLLPYHRLGVGKALSLGIPSPFTAQPPSDERMESLRSLVESRGVPVKIGG